MKAFDLACSLPWAIRPEALQVILNLAARAEVSPEVVAAAMAGTPEAVAARLGRPLDNTHAVQNRDGVAVIPIDGPIFRRASLFSEVSGAVSTDTLATDLQTALSDPSISAIALEIDSPGGEVAGTAELAEMIRAASATKPVWAYVDHLGCSAAYWLASAADRIVVAPTAILGSIGVVLAVNDPTKTKSSDIEFVSSQSPRKRADVTTEGGRAQVQSLVDALGDVFVSDVARYRGVTPETVLAEFGQGDVFVGTAAVTAGLADAVGSFEQAVTDLASEASTRGGITAPTRRAAVGMRDKFMAWLDGLDATASADQEAAIVTDNLDRPAPTTAPAARPSADLTALTGRMTALETELTAAKALTESQATAIKTLSEQNAALAKQARSKRFTDEVMGKSDANGTRWFGEVAKHVAMLEHLAESAGEDSELFTAYVAQQRSLGEQVRSSSLLTEIGSGQSGESAGDAGVRLSAMAQARIADGKAKDYGEAMGQLEREQPGLMAEYREATAKKI